jgi:hypothetical protein
VLLALRDGEVEPRPVHVPSPAPAVDLSDCECAIPAKPPSEHGRHCPVYSRWAAAGHDTAGITAAHLSEVESATALITEHRFPWCRARLLHALGAAEEQGVLDEVLLELLGESPSVGEMETTESMRKTLSLRGWSK